MAIWQQHRRLAACIQVAKRTFSRGISRSGSTEIAGVCLTPRHDHPLQPSRVLCTSPQAKCSLIGHSRSALSKSGLQTSRDLLMNVAKTSSYRRRGFSHHDFRRVEPRRCIFPQPVNETTEASTQRRVEPTAPSPGLSARQSAVLGALRAKMDANKQVEAKAAVLAEAANVPLGLLHSILQSLEKKGLIKNTRAGSARAPAAYQVLQVEHPRSIAA